MNRTWACALIACALSTMAPRAAHACGGCFSPPPPPATPEAIQVVTDHRMVFALSEQQTTLWDQIRYAGSPENFIWVLPVADASRLQVGLADDAFVEALDEKTAPRVTGALPVCPNGYQRYYSGAFYGCGGGSNAGGGLPPGAGSESTTISHSGEAIVGPYAIEVIHTDAGGMALDQWLTAHGFMVPDSTRAAIGFYVGLQFDFIVVHLAPGAGVQQMQPIRITTRGYSPVLPLRMIAAGIAEKVGLTLMVLANSRMRTQNFRNAVIHESDLTYDYVTHHSNWSTVWDRALHADTTRPAWITESAFGLPPDELTYIAGSAFHPDGGVGNDSGTLRDAAPLMDVAFGDDGPSMFADGFTVDADADTDAALGDDATSSDDVALLGDGAAFDSAQTDSDAQSTPDGASTDAGMMTPPDPYVDRRIAYTGLGDNAIVTRIRTSIGPSDLNTDLFLEASDEAGILPEYVADTMTNGPQCNPDNACAVVGGGTPAVLEAIAVVVLALRWRRRRARRARAA